MKMGIITTGLGLLLVTSAVATKLPDSENTVEIITSLEQIERIAKDTQKQFWQLVPPASDDPFYLHPDGIVRAVDWSSGDWPTTVLENVYAEMETAGLSRSMYPFYRITVVETRAEEPTRQPTALAMPTCEI